MSDRDLVAFAEELKQTSSLNRAYVVRRLCELAGVEPPRCNHEWYTVFVDGRATPAERCRWCRLERIHPEAVV